MRINSVTAVPSRTSMPRRCNETSRRVAKFLGKRRQDGGSRFDEQDSGTRGIDRLELVAQRLPRDLRERPCELDPGRTATDDDEREQFTLSARILLPLGALEGDQDAPPDRDGIFQRLQSRRVRLPISVAEVRVTRSSRDDQPVVVERSAVASTRRGARSRRCATRRPGGP